MVFQISNICFPSQKPKKLVCNGTERKFLSGQKRKPFAQRESHLGSEQTFGTYAGAVTLQVPFFENALQEIEILLFHGNSPLEGGNSLPEFKRFGISFTDDSSPRSMDIVPHVKRFNKTSQERRMRPWLVNL
jgi:hypothetical protein